MVVTLHHCRTTVVNRPRRAEYTTPNVNDAANGDTHAKSMSMSASQHALCTDESVRSQTDGDTLAHADTLDAPADALSNAPVDGLVTKRRRTSSRRSCSISMLDRSVNMDPQSSE